MTKANVTTPVVLLSAQIFPDVELNQKLYAFEAFTRCLIKASTVGSCAGEGETEELGDRLALGLADADGLAEADAEGEAEADGEIEAEAEGLVEADGEIDVEAEGERDGEALALGEDVADKRESFW